MASRHLCNNRRPTCFTDGKRKTSDVISSPFTKPKAPGYLSCPNGRSGLQGKKPNISIHYQQTRNRLDHRIYAPLLFLCFYFYLFIYSFIYFLVFFFFPKSAQVGLRLPDTRTSTATRASFYSIYVCQEKGGRQERGNLPPQVPPPGDLCAQQMEVCAPQQLAPHWLIFCWFSSDIYFEKA